MAFDRRSLNTTDWTSLDRRCVGRGEPLPPLMPRKRETDWGGSWWDVAAITASKHHELVGAQGKVWTRDSASNICCAFTAILWTTMFAASLNDLLRPRFTWSWFPLFLQMFMQRGFYRSNLSSLTCDLASAFCGKPQTHSWCKFFLISHFLKAERIMSTQMSHLCLSPVSVFASIRFVLCTTHRFASDQVRQVSHLKLVIYWR